MKSETEHLEYLDDILLFLRDKPYAVARFDETQTYIFNKQHQKKTEENLRYMKVKFHEAMNYLVEIGMLSKSQIANTEIPIYTLTFKGQIKTTFGFIAEYEKEKVDRELRHRQLMTSITLSQMQKWTIWISVCLALAAIGISLFSLSKKSGDTYYYGYDASKVPQAKSETLGRNIETKVIPKETSSQPKKLSLDTLD